MSHGTFISCRECPQRQRTPAQLGGGLEEKKSYSVGLSRFQSDRVKTFEGREGGADGAGCGEMDFGVLEFVGEGVAGECFDIVIVKGAISVAPSNSTSRTATNMTNAGILSPIN